MRKVNYGPLMGALKFLEQFIGKQNFQIQPTDGLEFLYVTVSREKPTVESGGGHYVELVSRRDGDPFKIGSKGEIGK